MDAEGRHPRHRLEHAVGRWWLLAVFAVGLLAAACVQEATDVTDTVARGEQTITTVEEVGAATTVAAGNATAANSTTSSVPPRLRVVLEQVVGGSLLEPELSEDGSIMPPIEASHMNAVAAGPAGLIAVGESRETATGNLNAAVWTSPDGHEWTLVVDELGAFGDAASHFDEQPEQFIVDVVTSPAGVVAVGADGVLFDHDAAIWASEDGSIWKRVAHDAAVFGGEGDQFINAVVQLGGQLVAVGESAERATVWTSIDGIRWAKAEVADAYSGPSTMNDVSPFDGGFVAVGSAGADLCPAVWLSPDGQSWRGISAEMAGGLSGFAVEECALSPMGNVVGGGRRLVATGTRLLSDEDPSFAGLTTDGPLVWTSFDGFEWVQEETSFVPADDIESRYGYLKHGAPIQLDHVVSDGERLFAGGSYELMLSANDLPGFATLWYSDDGGVTWLMAGELTMPPAGVSIGVRGLSVFDGGLVLVGADAAPAGPHPDYGWMTWSSTPAVWIAPVAES